MPLTKNKLASNNKYLAATYEIVSIKTRKDEHVNERLVMGAKKAHISKRQYILSTLLERLNADGIPMIPDSNVSSPTSTE